MCKVYTYPVASDLQAANTAVKIFLATRNGATRNTMIGVLKAILDRYGIDKLSFLDYRIERGRYGGVRIIPRQFTEGTVCPVCGGSLYGETCAILTIIEGDSGDIVSYGCGCGTITGRWEEK